MSQPQRALSPGDPVAAPEPVSGANGREYLACLGMCLALYGITAAPGPLWQDNGLAQVRAVLHDPVGDLGLALAHPLYYLIAIPATSIPFGEPARWQNLLSAVFGALAVANALALLGVLGAGRAARWTGAASIALAHTFWQHASMTETYALVACLLSCELLCVARFIRDGQARWLMLALLANGLGVSNHLMAVLTLPVLAGVGFWALRSRRIAGRHLAAGGGLWLAGASIYLLLIARELLHGTPAMEVVESALFSRYEQRVLTFVPSPALLARGLQYLALNFPTPAALLALGGLAVRRTDALRPMRWVLVAAAAIHLAWALRYPVVDQYTFFVPSVLVVGVLIGLGGQRWLAASRALWRRGLLLLVLLPPLVYAPLPWVVRKAGINLGLTRKIPYRQEYRYFLWPWKTGYHGARRFAEEAEAVLPEHAILIGDSTAVQPIHYRMVMGRWSKQTLLSPPPPNRPQIAPTRAQIEAGIPEGRVFVITPQVYYAPEWLVADYDFEPAGVLYRVRPRE
jgi:hypothetical protein